MLQLYTGLICRSEGKYACNMRGLIKGLTNEESKDESQGSEFLLWKFSCPY
ncbi:hypothetical protein PITCH_A1680014 [uncultured Desulfobacterium sp.]|uniref:Uncharacterized protein n=1 Tax=uncultured Desulfobacterium sp. TaxID=201089 RepID=A0A445MUC1_9BACT|nr:hypothetical protein PITCH_A1680014 [uncultured Desulfobacterium sp.]